MMAPACPPFLCSVSFTRLYFRIYAASAFYSNGALLLRSENHRLEREAKGENMGPIFRGKGVSPMLFRVFPGEGAILSTVRDTR